MGEAYFFGHFAALNEHLQELLPIFDDFCARNGFVYANKESLGRYPRIRIEKNGATNIYYDLRMGLDREGHRFEQFRHDLPYDLSAGAYLVVQDGSKYGIHFSKYIQCFSGKPFDQMSVVLQSEMQKHLPMLKEWDVQYLKDNGKKVQLGGF
jgi:hypothetical protein